MSLHRKGGRTAALSLVMVSSAVFLLANGPLNKILWQRTALLPGRVLRSDVQYPTKFITWINVFGGSKRNACVCVRYSAHGLLILPWNRLRNLPGEILGHCSGWLDCCGFEIVAVTEAAACSNGEGKGYSGLRGEGLEFDVMGLETHRLLAGE